MPNRSGFISSSALRQAILLITLLLGGMLPACTPTSSFDSYPLPSTPLPTSATRSLPPIQTETPMEVTPVPTAASATPTATVPADPDPTLPAGAQKSWTTSDPAFTVEAGQHPYSYLTKRKVEIRYLMYLPETYDPARPWPLILYLHSSLEEGSDLELLKQRALPQKLEDENDFPFIVVSPQISEGYWYQNIDELEDLLNGLEALLPIDSQRLYLTGFSLGGFGTWAYAYRYPERFAAIAPVAGSLDLGTEFKIPYDICKMKSLPVWAFHGAQDTTVNPHEEETLVKVLSTCGADAKITIYADAGHMASGDRAYDDPDLYDWFLAHKH